MPVRMPMPPLMCGRLGLPSSGRVKSPRILTLCLSASIEASSTFS
jgi:hypothetical protein